MTVFKRKVKIRYAALWALMLIAVLVLGYINDTLSWYSLIWLTLLFLNVIKPLIQDIYIPLTGHITVDKSGIFLKSKISSWSIQWKELDIAYQNKGNLIFTCKGKLHKELIHANEWLSDDNNKITDEIKQYISVRPYKEMPHRPVEFKDYEPALKNALIIVIGLLLILMLSSMYIHRYHPNGGGTSIPFYLFCGALAAGTVSFYLYKHNVNSESSISTTILALIVGLFSAPVILKAYTIALNDVQTHRFELVKKIGGYQHWVSQKNQRIEIKLGSVNNKIHTENDQGTVLELKLIEGRFLTLFLPNEIEKTRYKK